MKKEFYTEYNLECMELASRLMPFFNWTYLNQTSIHAFVYVQGVPIFQITVFKPEFIPPIKEECGIDIDSGWRNSDYEYENLERWLGTKDEVIGRLKSWLEELCTKIS